MADLLVWARKYPRNLLYTWANPVGAKKTKRMKEDVRFSIQPNLFRVNETFYILAKLRELTIKHPNHIKVFRWSDPLTDKDLLEEMERMTEEEGAKDGGPEH